MRDLDDPIAYLVVFLTQVDVYGRGIRPCEALMLLESFGFEFHPERSHDDRLRLFGTLMWKEAFERAEPRLHQLSRGLYARVPGTGRCCVAGYDVDTVEIDFPLTERARHPRAMRSDT